nr:MAG TPA: hypothetical protein [Caudoviricetes sp.]
MTGVYSRVGDFFFFQFMGKIGFLQYREMKVVLSVF